MMWMLRLGGFSLMGAMVAAGIVSYLNATGQGHYTVAGYKAAMFFGALVGSGVQGIVFAILKRDEY